MHASTSALCLSLLAGAALVPLALAACGGGADSQGASASAGGGAPPASSSPPGPSTSPPDGGCCLADANDADAADVIDGSSHGACTVAPVTITHDGTMMNVAAEQHFVDTKASPLAVCNDGTPATFFTRQGYGGGATRWLISLEGGGSCYDAASCQARRDGTAATDFQLTTSNTALVMANGGILSNSASENEDFYDANLVRIHYCSSDSWEGTHAGAGTFSDSDPSTWSFQGHAIVTAVLQELMTRGLADATEVILEGESAGGAGVFFNANVVAAALPSTARFVAISDAAVQLDLPNYDPTAPGSVSTAPPPYLVEQHETAALALWHGTGDPTCTTAGGSLDDCAAPAPLLDQNRFPFPVFVRQSEEDQQKFHDFGAPTPPATGNSAAQAFFTYFEGQERSFLSALPSPYSAFGPNITDHIDLLGGAPGEAETFSAPLFTFPGGDSLTTEQAIHQWYANPCTQQIWVQ
jgi:hypothetical protein